MIKSKYGSESDDNLLLHVLLLPCDAADTKYLIMCQGKLPHTLDEERHLKLGATLGNFLESLDKRVVLAISGDLSHTYSHNCTDPLYLPDPR